MEVKMKLEDVSKNIARFVVIQFDEKGEALKPASAPNYGQADVVFPEEEAEELREQIGKTFTVTFEAED